MSATSLGLTKKTKNRNREVHTLTIVLKFSTGRKYNQIVGK